ncbi:MAG: LysR family transcriptional regulator [Oscillospiraceae bacterium]|nr:LysR family transcriptional regulator [Oscillospiraceae bacterium]
MSTEKYRVFLKTVDSGSFSAVAQELGYTPSGIVHMMNSLEEQFGFPLLIRSHKGVRLTENGQRVLPIVRNIVRWEESLHQTCSDICGVVAGDISIGSYFSIASAWLPGTIRSFQQDHPNVRIHVQEGVHQELDTLITEHRVDFCIYSYPPANGMQWLPLKRDPMVAVLPADHPMASAESFPIGAFEEEPFIMPAGGYDYDIMTVFGKHKIEPRISYSTGEDHAAISMVESGLGITLLNELATSKYISETVRLPLEPQEYAAMGVAAPSIRKLSPAARLFVRYLEKYVGSL